MAATELFATSLYNDASLVSYYRMEGNSNDSKGTNNGVDTSISYSTGNGKFNQGAGFNGTSSLITIPANASLNFGTSNRSINLWANVPASGTTDSRFYDNRNDDLTWWSFNYNYSNGTVPRVGFEFSNTYPSHYDENHNGIAYNDGNWHMYTLVVSGTNINIYTDGYLTTNSTWGQYNTDGSTKTNYIGAYHTSIYQQFFKQYIDDISIFSRALTSTEISNLYNSTSFLLNSY